MHHLPHDESGLGGALRHLESVYDALKTRTGSELAEPVSNVAGVLSGLIENVNGMDSAAFQGILSGLSVIAGAGPGLLTVGGGLNVTGDTTTLTATIQAEDGQTLMQYVDGDAGPLHATIMSEDGQTLEEIVTGDASALGAAIAAYDGQVVTVTVAYVSSGGPALGGGTVRIGRSNAAAGVFFAEGGRATSASIFGEAGPEWAIPEEHTERTAQLLDAARRASGFTWPELLGRNGGLNAGGAKNWTLVYKPTIVAGNAEGVEQKLIEDKKRLENWMRRRELMDEMEVYA